MPDPLRLRDSTGISVALKKLFQFLHQTTQALAEIPRAEAALRLYLQCAQAASDCNLEPVTYEFMERAYEIFEESIPGEQTHHTALQRFVDCSPSLFSARLPDSKAQVTALQLIIGSLQRCTVFGSENRASLVHKATGYSAKLLKKPDQCRAVYTCAHLFWHDTDETLCDAESVLACLKRALKIANAAQVSIASTFRCVLARSDRGFHAQAMSTASRGESAGVALFVEILNKCVLVALAVRVALRSHAMLLARYLYFFDKGCEAVTPDVLKGLLELINNELGGDAGKSTEVDSFYKATLQHIRAQQAKEGDTAARYAGITV